NNSTVAGLAAQTASFLEDEGFAISETGNYSEGLLTSTAVYYGTTPGEQQVATEVAEALGVSAQPRFEGIRNAPAGVIVIVTSQSSRSDDTCGLVRAARLCSGDFSALRRSGLMV